MVQTKLWKYAGFASAVVGLLCYALSSSFNYLFGEWNLLKVFLFIVFSFITCVAILFADADAETGQHSRSHWFKAHTAFLVLTITSVYSFFSDKLMNGKPADAYSLISCAAFAVMSLSLSKQTQCGFEVDLLYFFLGCLLVQLMKTKLPLVIVGVGFSYSLVVLRSSFPSMNAAAQDNAYSGLPDNHFVAVEMDRPHPGLPDDNSADPDVDSRQLASFSSADAAAADNEYPGIPDDNSGDPDIDSLQLVRTDIASNMMEQLSRPPAVAMNGSGYFQDAGPDAMPGNPYQQQQQHQRQSRRKLERTNTVLLTTYDSHDWIKPLNASTRAWLEEVRTLFHSVSDPSLKKLAAEMFDWGIQTLKAYSKMTEDVSADDGSQVVAKSRKRGQLPERVQLPAAKDRRGSYKRSHMLTANFRNHLRHRSSRQRE